MVIYEDEEDGASDLPQKKRLSLNRQTANEVCVDG